MKSVRDKLVRFIKNKQKRKYVVIEGEKWVLCGEDSCGTVGVDVMAGELKSLGVMSIVEGGGIYYFSKKNDPRLHKIKKDTFSRGEYWIRKEPF